MTKFSMAFLTWLHYRQRNLLENPGIRWKIRILFYDELLNQFVGQMLYVVADNPDKNIKHYWRWNDNRFPVSEILHRDWERNDRTDGRSMCKAHAAVCTSRLRAVNDQIWWRCWADCGVWICLFWSRVARVRDMAAGREHKASDVARRPVAWCTQILNCGQWLRLHELITKVLNEFCKQPCTLYMHSCTYIVHCTMYVHELQGVL